MFNKKHTGIYFAFLTAIISGVSIFVNKFAVTAIKQPLVFTTVKNTGVALLILGILLTSGKWRKIKVLKAKKIIFLILIGIIGGSIPFYLFFTGLASIPAVNGAIINKTMVLWVAILAWPILKERLSNIGKIAVLILFGANILVGGFKGFAFSTGELLVAMATVMWAVETILAKKILPNVDPDIVMTARMGFGAIILLGMSAILQPAAFSKVAMLNPTQWAWIGVTIVLLFSYISSWYKALKYAPAVTVTAIMVASTLVTNVLSAVFVTHSVNTIVFVQSAFIFLGVLIIALQTSKYSIRPEVEV